jgi:hypothetical protein
MKTALDLHLKETFGLRYQPGEHDCVLFLARWADIVAGSAIEAELRGSYTTHFQGLRRHAPKSTICGSVEARLLAAGWQLVPGKEEFREGDIILTDIDHPGIWRGKSIVATAFGAAGHAYLHRRHATSALRWPGGAPALAGLEDSAAPPCA